MIKSNTKNHFLIKIFKYFIPPLILIFIFRKVYSDFQYFDYSFKLTFFDFKSIIYLFILLLLMVLNWFLESVKWKFLISKLVKISYSEAFISIINGLAFGLFTPFKLGDILARILHINASQRSKAFGSLLISRASQLVVTMFFGGLGLAFFLSFKYRIDFIFQLLIAVAFFITPLIFMFKIKAFLPLMKKMPFVSDYIHWIDIISNYNYADYVKILFYSTLRYGIFILQYFVIFKMLKIDFQLEHLLFGMALTFLIKSIIPIGSFVADFGVREFTAITIFGYFGYSSVDILVATSAVWVVNIIIPSTAGVFFSRKIKL